MSRGTLDQSGGTVTGLVIYLGHRQISTRASPVSSLDPCLSSLPPERSKWLGKPESGMGLQIVLEYISKWALE